MHSIRTTNNPDKGKKRPHLPLLLLALVVSLWTPAETVAREPITLRQAVELALEHNPSYQAARAGSEAAAAGLREARSALFPQLSIAESFERSSDPVFAFGTKLRQQRFGAADFDLGTLNTPAPVNNFHTRLSARWTVFDFGQSSSNVASARHMSRSAGYETSRAEQELIARVVSSYYNLLLALRHRDVAEQAVRTAEAILAQTNARVEAGIAVESDRLTAEVALAERRQEEIQAGNACEIARALLSHELGAPSGADFEPVEDRADVPSPSGALEEWERLALEQRPDLNAVAEQLSAQEKRVAAARSAFAPSIQVMGQWDNHNRELLTGGGSDWTLAAQVEWQVFNGGARRARLTRARADRDRIASVRRLAESGVKLEARQAYLELDAASRQVEVARSAVAQAEEGLRILEDRYQAGLATITDLLRAEEATTRARTRYWETVYRYRTGWIRLELAAGILTPSESRILREETTP